MILLQVSGLAKSVYYYTLSKKNKDDKNKEIIDKIKEMGLKFRDEEQEVRMAYRKLNRDTKKRKSILSGQTKTVIMNEKIQTTEERAKETRKFVDKMITYAKKGDLNSRRKALAFLENDTVAVKKLFDELAPRYADRQGGYTRIIKLQERIGDDALIVSLELV